MNITRSAQNPNKIERVWYLVDAKGKILGRIATAIARLLRGKDKPIYDPARACGDFVVVINSKEIKFTGKKLEQKQYYRHSGYIGGLKSQTLAELFQKDPSRVLLLAVSGMIPNNRLKKEILKRLKIYSGSEHKHQAQKLIEVKNSQ